MSLELSGVLWSGLELFGALWSSLELSGVPCPPNKLQLALITVCNRQLGVAGSTLLWGCLGANKQEKASDGLELGARGAGWGCGVWGLRGAGAGKPFGACAVKF